jgi:uncharacterized spore protein YtfJ
MDLKTLVEQAKDSVSVKQVFGEPVERDGVTVIPVARIAGGGGGGGGKQEGENPGQGSGGGFGLGVSPTGVFTIKDGKVRWVPVVDVDRAILGGQIALVAALLLVRAIARARTKARRAKS